MERFKHGWGRRRLNQKSLLCKSYMESYDLPCFAILKSRGHKNTGSIKKQKQGYRAKGLGEDESRGIKEIRGLEWVNQIKNV